MPTKYADTMASNINVDSDQDQSGKGLQCLQEPSVQKLKEHKGVQNCVFRHVTIHINTHLSMTEEDEMQSDRNIQSFVQDLLNARRIKCISTSTPKNMNTVLQNLHKNAAYNTCGKAEKKAAIISRADSLPVSIS